MKHALLAIILTLTGCTATATNRAGEMHDHGQSSIRRANRDADDRVASEAEADILRAFMKLKGNLRENSSVAFRRGNDMDRTLRGWQFSPEGLGNDIGRLMDAAAEADSRRLLNFRRSIADRDNPDGFDPVRRAILDRELERRGVRGLDSPLIR